MPDETIPSDSPLTPGCEPDTDSGPIVLRCPEPVAVAVELPALRTLPPAETLRRVAAGLGTARPGGLFVHSGRLVERQDRVGLAPVSVDRVSALIQQAVTVKKVAKDGAITFGHVPRIYAQWLRADPAQHFPAIRGVRTLPFLTSDRQIARTRGYYPDDRIWLDWSPPGSSGSDAVPRTAEILRRLFGAGSEPSHGLGLLAFLIETVARPAVTGRVPFYVVTSTHGWGCARDLGRALAGFALGRATLDRGLPSRNFDLAAFAAAAVPIDGPCVLLEGVQQDAPLVWGDLDRLLRGSGVVSLRKPGATTPIQADPGLTSWIASAFRRPADPAPGEVPIRIGAAPKAVLDSLVQDRDAILECIVGAVASWLEAGQPVPVRPVPLLRGWSQVVGGVLSNLLGKLDIGDEDDVAAWLDGLGAAEPPPPPPWQDLFAVWPQDETQTALPVGAAEIVSLARESGLSSLIPTVPPGSQQSEDAALGSVLADLVRDGVPIGGHRLTRHRKRNGWTYLPVAVEQDAEGLEGAEGDES